MRGIMLTAALARRLLCWIGWHPSAQATDWTMEAVRMKCPHCGTVGWKPMRR